jgi:hypothetical protein
MAVGQRVIDHLAAPSFASLGVDHHLVTMPRLEGTEEPAAGEASDGHIAGAEPGPGIRSAFSELGLGPGGIFPDAEQVDAQKAGGQQLVPAILVSVRDTDYVQDGPILSRVWGMIR